MSMEIINRSGFPFQIYVAHLIATTAGIHGWQVSVQEHRWRKPETGEEKFIDLVLQKTSLRLKAAVECKKIDGSWIFLSSSPAPSEVRFTRLLGTRLRTGSIGWRDYSLYPPSHESAFCVLGTNDKQQGKLAKDGGRTMERISGDLLLSLESLAKDEVTIIRNVFSEADLTGTEDIDFLPMIVTTAKLQLCGFDPSTVVDGEIGHMDDKDLIEVPYMRFRKNLSSEYRISEQSITTLGQMNKAYDRTVFIVQANNLQNFLALIDRFGEV